MLLNELILSAARQYPLIKDLLVVRASLSKEQINSLLKINLSPFFKPPLPNQLQLDDFCILLMQEEKTTMPLHIILTIILQNVPPGEELDRIAFAYEASMRDSHNNIMALLEKIFPDELQCDLRLTSSDFGIPEFSDDEETEQSTFGNFF
jgi:hypothetical protein